MHALGPDGPRGMTPRRVALLSVLIAGALSLGVGAGEADTATKARLAPATVSVATESPEARLLATVGEEHGDGLAGFSVAMSGDGNTALVGAPADDGFAGAVWVFTRKGSNWVQQGSKLTAGELTAGEGTAGGESCEEESRGTGGEEGSECGFGRALAISDDGNTALVGAPRQNEQRGAAWVFTRSEGTWSRTHMLTGGPGESPKGRFGRAVALSGDAGTAIVSAPGDQSGRGRAWVFKRSGLSWSQQGESLVGSGEAGESHFGGSLALSDNGERALVGGPGDNDYLGAVWAFERSGEEWREVSSKLTDVGASPGAHFGASVALSADGTTALVGGRGQQEGMGAAWVFSSTGGSTWSEQGPPLSGGDEAGEEFGYSVALSADGSTALVGAPQDRESRGSAWLFERSGTSWDGAGERFEGGALETGKGSFGTSVALSADAESALVGAESDHGKVGAAFIFGPSPSVSGVSPGEGPAAGGTTVTISGANLGEANAVRFGESAAASFAVDSPSTITVVTPPGKGVVHITVQSPYGTSLEGSSDRFHYNPSDPGPSSGSPAGTSPATTTINTPVGATGVLGFAGISGGGCGVALLSKKLTVRVSKRAWVLLGLRGSGLGRCSGKLRLRVHLQAGHRHTALETIGTAVYTVLSGHSITVKLELNATGRALLKARHGHLNGNLLLVKSSPAPTLSRTASVRVTRRKTRGQSTPRK
jgi:hypothetical protein